MPTTPAEQTDIATLVAFIEQKKINAFELLRATIAGDIELHHCGYKSIEQAAISIIGEVGKQIEKAVRAHERKWGR